MLCSIYYIACLSFLCYFSLFISHLSRVFPQRCFAFNAVFILRTRSFMFPSFASRERYEKRMTFFLSNPFVFKTDRMSSANCLDKEEEENCFPFVFSSLDTRESNNDSFNSGICFLAFSSQRSL